MAVKVTFTLGEDTVEQLRLTAERLRQPKSAVVRDAVREYYSNSERLPVAERNRMLRVLDEFAARRPAQTLVNVEPELAELRASRRRSGRRHATS